MKMPSRYPLLVLVLSLPLAAPVRAQTSPAPAFAIQGETADDDFGWCVAPAGDVNGDGFPDLIAGAPSNDAVAGFAGRAYLFLGPFSGDLDAADAAAVISAEAFGDNLGFSVASAGDTNGDGLDDLLLGARSNDGAGIQAGRVYLFLGPVSGSLAATSADAIVSGAAFDEVGRSVASAGDLDGDGLDDLVLGTSIAGPAFEGQAFVFYGPVSGMLAVSSADATITGVIPNESLGASVASAGDVNQDGRPDLILGAPRFPLDGTGTGTAYVFHGPVVGSMSAAAADAILVGEAVNDSFGTSVAGAGDVNRDGIPDVIVGADQLFASGQGKAYVFHGPLSGTISAANADAILVGEGPDNLFGAAVSRAGDFNGDGFGDVLVGAWDNGSGGGRSGRAYVFHGPLQGTRAAGTADFIVTGAAGDELGLFVAPAGDLNRDGAGDLFLGAPQFNAGDPGYAVVFLGSPAFRKLPRASTR